MRLFVLTALMVIARPAFACEFVPEVLAVSPPAGALVPARGQVILTSWIVDYSITASLVFDPPREPVALISRRLGPYARSFEIPTGVAEGAIGLEAFFTLSPEQGPLFLPLTWSDLDDLTPPTPPTLINFTAEATRDICFAPAVEFTATFSDSSDDWQLAAYVLYEEIEGFDVTRWPVGVTAAESIEPTAFRRMVVFEPGIVPGPERRCFHLVARDLAGNESAPSETICVGGATIDAGVLDSGGEDGGLVDARVEAADATVPNAAPAASTLASAPDSCGCATVAGTTEPREGPVVLWASVGLAWLAFRRKARPAGRR